LEHRKLIKFGNSSHVISIPNLWLKKNNLVKGDTLYLEENGSNELILTSEKKENAPPENKEITIRIESKDERDVKRKIVSAYINNYKTIKLVEKDIEKRSDEIRNILKKLSGVEVLEQTKDYIVAKDFINMKAISLIHLIRRMDILTRNMLIDAQESFTNKKLYQSLMQRDQDINRLLFVVYRLAKFLLKNPENLSKNNLETLDVVVYGQIADHLERFADETKRSSRYIMKLKGTIKEKSEFQSLYKEIESCYLAAMKALYSKDCEGALKVANTTKMLIEKCKKISTKTKEKEAIILVERFKTMVNHIRTIIRLIYN